MKAILVSLLVSLVVFKSEAKSLGIIGSVFPVMEMSFLTFIEERINQLNQDGTFNHLQEKWQRTAEKKANRPKPCVLSAITNTQTHFYIPAVTLSNPIYDAFGKVIFAAGTKRNGLAEIPGYKPCWLFIDGDDLSQIAWAKKQLNTCSKPKLILTNGSVKEAENKFNRVIYFVQAGVITKKLNIQAVPSKVTRQGNKLLVREVAIKENGHEVL